MKKKLAVGILTLGLLVCGAGVAMGSVDSNASELKDLYNQMFNIQKQIVDKQAESGVIPETQANNMKEMIEQKAKRSTEAIENGRGSGFGFGMGHGYCGGWGGSWR